MSVVYPILNLCVDAQLFVSCRAHNIHVELMTNRYLQHYRLLMLFYTPETHAAIATWIGAVSIRWLLRYLTEVQVLAQANLSLEN